MSYLAFLAIFIVPPLLALAWTQRRRLRTLHPRAPWFLAAMPLIALVYTTPWDNYLVWRGVWGYGPDRVLGTIGYVPVEEYLFFLLQPLLTALWLCSRLPVQPSAAGNGPRWTGAALYAAAAALGAWLLGRTEGTYLGLILSWAAPVLALQWAYAGREIWARRRAFLAAVAVPTLYLWAADSVAISLGIWHISEAHTLGPSLGLPLEEAVFFLATNLLVVQGMILFLHPPARRR